MERSHLSSTIKFLEQMEFNMDEKYFSVIKVEGGFIVDSNEPRKVVRRLSEVVALLKEAMKDDPEATPE